MKNILKNQEIVHKKFGEGTILNYDGKNIVVDFKDGCKTLEYQMVIDKGIIVFKDKRTTEAINDYNRAKKEEQEKKEKEVLFKMRLEEEHRKVIEKEKDKCNREKLLAILHEFGFEGFLHTTELENFKIIVSSGFLYSRIELEKSKITFNDSADHEVLDKTRDDVKSCCRFYYYFKTPTNNKAGYSHPVIIVFDENLIFEEGCEFTAQNAAKTYSSEKTTDAKEALSFSWDGIFERGGYSYSKYYETDENGYQTKKSKDLITGMRNAEFLVHHKVGIDKIHKIYFKNRLDLVEATEFCPKTLVEKFCEDRSKFDE